MAGYMYLLSGCVLPERAQCSISEIKFGISASDDVPAGEVSIEIVLNQIFAKFVSENEAKNIFTLRNIVEDLVRMIVDVLGYFHGYAYDVEITQLVRPDGPEKQVFGIDVPALSQLCQQAGLNPQQIFAVIAGPAGYFLRHALADTREAIKSPKDTGFFCYRAIETLKNYVAANAGVERDDKDGWRLFRENLEIDIEDVMLIKSFADPVRHGNYLQARPISDQDRVNIFMNTWMIVNKFVRSQKIEPAAETGEEPGSGR